MIQNLRDAELQIETIKRAQNDLIRELKSLKLNKNNSNGSEVKVQTVGEVDSILNADKNTVIHKLFHIFDKIKAKTLDLVDPLPISDGGTGSDNASGARTNLNIYSKPEIDTLLSEKDTQFQAANLTVTLTTSVQDIPNTNITLAKAGLYSLRASFDLFSTGVGESNVSIICLIWVDGVNLSGYASKQVNPTASSNESTTISQQWLYAAATPGIQIKLQAFKSGGTGVSQVNHTNTNLYAQWQRF